MHAVVSVGNTDNKLTQQEWAQFVDEIRIVIARYRDHVHFFGGPSNWQPWQNVACIVEIAPIDVGDFKLELIDVRKKYGQDSIFVMTGDGEML